MTDAQMNVIGCVVVGAVCVAVGFMLFQVIGTLFGVNLTLLRATEFWAAITGALVGGLFALFAQWLAIRTERKQREDDRFRTQQALAMSLLLKVRDMHGNYVESRRSIEEQFSEAEQMGMVDEPWRFFKPFSSNLTHFHFTPDEKATLLELKNDKLLNETLLLEPRHFHYVESLRTLNRLIFELHDKALPVYVEGDQGRVELPHDEFMKLKPRMLQVDSLIDALRAEASEDADVFGRLMEELSKAYKDKLRLPFEIAPPRRKPHRASPLSKSR